MAYSYLSSTGEGDGLCNIIWTKIVEAQLLRCQSSCFRRLGLQHVLFVLSVLYSLHPSTQEAGKWKPQSRQMMRCCTLNLRAAKVFSCTVVSLPQELPFFVSARQYRGCGFWLYWVSQNLIRTSLVNQDFESFYAAAENNAVT